MNKTRKNIIKHRKTIRNKIIHKETNFGKRVELPIGTTSKGIIGTEEMDNQILFLKNYFKC